MKRIEKQRYLVDKIYFYIDIMESGHALRHMNIDRLITKVHKLNLIEVQDALYAICNSEQNADEVYSRLLELYY